MNSTVTNSIESMSGFEYSTIILGTLLVVSELLPFIKKYKTNGLVDSIVCLLRGSSCVTGKLADIVEECENKIETKQEDGENFNKV